MKGKLEHAVQKTEGITENKGECDDEVLMWRSHMKMGLGDVLTSQCYCGVMTRRVTKVINPLREETIQAQAPVAD